MKKLIIFLTLATFFATASAQEVADTANVSILEQVENWYAEHMNYATITALLNNSKSKFSILVNESGYDLNFDYSKALTPDMIYSNGNILNNNTAMQSFDILKNGDIIYGGAKNDAAYFQRKSPNQAAGEHMTIWFSGHCSNFSVEEHKGSSSCAAIDTEHWNYTEQSAARNRWIMNKLKK